MVAALALCIAAVAATPPRGRDPSHAVARRNLADLPSEQRTVVWTPADVAAWSGPGLRDGHVVDIEPAPRGVWVMTARGGPALWDGRTWRHIDRRDGIEASRWFDLALARGTRWFAHDRGVSRVSAEGELKTWTTADGLPPMGVYAVHPIDGDHAWLATEDGLWRTSEDGVLPVLRGEPCHELMDDGTGVVVAACEPEKYRLPEATPYPHIPRNLLRPTAIVPTQDGAWISGYGGLYRRIGMDVTPAWTPADTDPQVRDLTRLDNGMLAACGLNGGWVVDEEGYHRLDAAGGTPGTAAWATAPHPHPQKAWLGTDEGVALVTSAGTATPLPLAPLASSVEVRDLQPHDTQAAVATSRGLVWLGPKPPSGWSNLVAAVGPHGLDLLYAEDKAWWVVTADASFRLDRRGRLSRWSTPGSQALPRAGAVGIRTVGGIRWWLPGARMLSPMESMRTTLASTGTDETLWTWDRGELAVHLAGERQGWPMQGVRAVEAVHHAAWVATADGLWSVRVGGQPKRMWPDRLGAVTDVALDGTRLWVADDASGVHHTEGDGLRTLTWDVSDARPRVLGLYPDPSGVWIHTDLGVYRVVVR